MKRLFIVTFVVLAYTLPTLAWHPLEHCEGYNFVIDEQNLPDSSQYQLVIRNPDKIRQIISIAPVLARLVNDKGEWIAKISPWGQGDFYANTSLDPWQMAGPTPGTFTHFPSLT